MKLVSTGSFAPHWMGMVCMVPDWNFVTNKAGLRVSRLPNSFTGNSDYPRVQMGIPVMPLGIGMGIPRGIDGYSWVSMGILLFLVRTDASGTAIGCVSHSACVNAQIARWRTRSRKRVRNYPEEIPRTGSDDPETIPSVVGIKSGSWRVSPLDFGIQKKICVLQGKTTAHPEIVGEFLREHGYVVLEAKNGAEGQRVAEQHRGNIDLLVTDMVMPKMGGRELAERLMVQRPALKTLYLSGYSESVAAPDPEGFWNGVFLQKPFSMNTLGRKVREVLQRAEKQDCAQV